MSYPLPCLFSPPLRRTPKDPGRRQRERGKRGKKRVHQAFTPKTKKMALMPKSGFHAKNKNGSHAKTRLLRQKSALMPKSGFHAKKTWLLRHQKTRLLCHPKNKIFCFHAIKIGFHATKIGFHAISKLFGFQALKNRLCATKLVFMPKQHF